MCSCKVVSSLCDVTDFLVYVLLNSYSIECNVTTYYVNMSYVKARTCVPYMYVLPFGSILNVSHFEPITIHTFSWQWTTINGESFAGLNFHVLTPWSISQKYFCGSLVRNVVNYSSCKIFTENFRDLRNRENHESLAQQIFPHLWYL